MSHHWAYCLYPGVKTLHPLVTNFARRYTLRRLNTEYLLVQARGWNLRADRRGYLAYALALRWHTVDPKTLLTMLFHVHEEAPDADIETYILYVHYQCFHMPKPSFSRINTAMFNEWMLDAFEIHRRARIHRNHDVHMYLMMQILCSWWVVHNRDACLRESRFYGWMTSVATVADSFSELLSTNPARAAILAAKEHGVIMSKRTVINMVKSIARFRWYTRRKRKRETTSTTGACGICFESGIAVERTRCGHDFCAGCLGSWGKLTCPACRANTG